MKNDRVSALDVARTQARGPAHAVVAQGFGAADKTLVSKLTALAKRASKMTPPEVGVELKELLEAYAERFMELVGDRRNVEQDDADRAERVAKEINRQNGERELREFLKEYSR